MKILGKRILNSDIRLVFEVDGDTLSTADAMAIERCNEAVVLPKGNSTSLTEFIACLQPLIVSEGEAKVGLEPIYDEE